MVFEEPPFVRVITSVGVNLVHVPCTYVLPHDSESIDIVCGLNLGAICLRCFLTWKFHSVNFSRFPREFTFLDASGSRSQKSTWS